MQIDEHGNLDYFLEDLEETVAADEPEVNDVPDTSASSKAVKEEVVEEAGAKTLDDKDEPEVTEVSDDVDKKRYEYWQSKHDHLRDDYAKLKDKATVDNDYAPIAEYLYNNPQALLKLQEQLTQESAVETNAPQMPKQPEKPERPANYSKYEAIQDPESIHAKYEEAQMSYQMDMLDYMNDKQQFIENKQQAEMQATMQQQQQTREQERFKSDLINNGLDANEYSDFIDKMYGKESTDPQNLIKYYKMLTGTGVTKGQLSKKEFEEQQQRIMNNPPPVGSEGGETTATPTEEELFNQSLLNWKR